MQRGRPLVIALLGVGSLVLLPASCIRRTVDPCRESCACKTLGRCSKAPDGSGQECAPATDVDCKDSLACRDTGHCKRKGLQCIVASDDDCKTASICRTLGACTAAEGGCVNTNPPPQPSILHGIIR